MKLSIIICTYNREKYIYNVLRSIAQNDFPTEEYEIVLIDNNCTDDTALEYQRFCTDFPLIATRYFIEENQGLSYARNRGIVEAKGDILVYVDDDATVNRAYLRTFADFFSVNLSVFAAGGPILPVYEVAEPRWMSFYTKQLLTAYLYQGEKIKEFKNGTFPGGGNAAYRKMVFQTVGLFNTELGRKGNSLAGAEEKDIFDKMRCEGMSFYYLPTAILYHIIPEKKLTKDYFNRLTVSIGESEKKRTLQISKGKYTKRLLLEMLKWGVTKLLCVAYTLALSPQKGWKLIQFRWNVTKGLIQKEK